VEVDEALTTINVTLRDMPDRGIVIAGAGVIGCSVAWHLAMRGRRDILVVDRHPTLGGGSTAKATGGFRTQFGTAVNVRLSMLSREKLLRFRDEVGVDPGYQPAGYLFLATTESAMRELRSAHEVQRGCGFHDTRILDRGDALALNPYVDHTGIIGGSFCPSDGFIRPMDILHGYAEGARRLGVRFEFGQDARPLDPAITYVNAAGAWASEFCDLPVTPLRRRVACTIATDVLPANMPMTIWADDGFHTRVRDGRVLLLWPDTPPDDEVWMNEVIARARRRIPILANAPIDPDRCWSGLYEMSPDRHAIVGRHPRMPNVYLANGSSGHGVMHAPAVGQLIAEMILDGETTIDVTDLRPSRFAEGKPVAGPTLL
jgi:sarcosine oxidase subunit beta